MKLLLSAFTLFIQITAFAQLEISSGFVVNKNNAVGFPIHLAYDFQIKNRLYTKSQLGYKYLHIYNDYVGGTLDISSLEIHQTFSYEIVKKRKFVLKPNVGINYRFYHWKGEMRPPYNTLPQRAWVIGTRDRNFILNSFDDRYYKERKVNNLGFSFQLQNQIKLSGKLWLHITPFIEPDYDRSQNFGGCYLGIILNSL